MALSESIESVREELSPEELIEFDTLLNSITDTTGYEKQMRQIKEDGKRHLQQIYSDAAENIEAAFQNEANEITKLF